MERTEWPTPGKVDELRDLGTAPFSARATQCVRNIAIVLILVGLSSKAPELFHLWRESVLTGERIRLPNDEFRRLLLTIALGGIAVSFIATLLQTRSLFKLEFLFSHLGKRVGGALSSPLRSLAEPGLITVGVGSAMFFLRDAFSLLNCNRNEISIWASEFLSRAVPAFLVLFLLVGGVSLAASWVSFLSAHRMTREEVRQYERARE